MDGLTNMVWRNATGRVVRSFSYGLNAMGMITNIMKENGERVVYTYDGLDRLVGEEVRDASNQVIYSGAYSYDLAGNRMNATTNGYSVDFILGEGNRLTFNDNNAALLHYNSLGCIDEFCNYNEEWNIDFGISWNARSEMTFIESCFGRYAFFGYDPLGRRVSEYDGVTTTKFVYDGNQVVADTDATGGVLRTYAWGPGIDNLLTMTVCTGASPVTYFAVKDHLGTVHAWTDEAGAVVESYRFDAWGNVMGVFDSSNSTLATNHSPLGNRYLWQGREYSWQTGFYYFRARWYDPRIGRWLSNDPIGISGGFNQYVFCGNDPVNNKDPLGLDAGLTGTAGMFDHKGIQVHVRGAEGQILGVLSADYHASGYMNDGRNREGNIITGTKGYVGITYYPGNKWPATISRVNGTAADDQRLVEWILGTIGKDAQWLNQKTKTGRLYGGDCEAVGDYKTYHWPGNVCYNYAYDAMEIYENYSLKRAEAILQMRVPGP